MKVTDDKTVRYLQLDLHGCGVKISALAFIRYAVSEV